MNPTPRRSPSPRYHFTSAEIDAAHEAWGCNCGPGALAMMLSLQPDQVRGALPGFEEKRYMNTRMMKASIQNLGVLFQNGSTHQQTHTGDQQRFAEYGVCRIQWTGPWCLPPDRIGGPPQVSKWGAMHTHWIGSMRATFDFATEEEIQGAIQILRTADRPSISHLQRKLVIGYTRAEQIVQEIARRGIVERLHPNSGAAPLTIEPNPDFTIGHDFHLYDANVGWMRPLEWKRQLVPILTHGIRRCDGGFLITNTIELWPTGDPHAGDVQEHFARGRCRKCGCTESDCRQCIAKDGAPCSWADDTESLCTSCL